MVGPERIHPVPRRGGIEYYREIACPDCGATVFALADDESAVRYDDLEVFGRHQCNRAPLIRAVATPAGPRTFGLLPGTRSGYPIDLGRIPPEIALGFRAGVEAAFGKKLARFSGALKRKGLPVHFNNEWEPSLGHVREFSKTDVHRDLDATGSLLKLVRPILEAHYRMEKDPSLRKYYFSARGIAKHHRSATVRVITWKWPARY
jgi:hypothetical protein